MPVIKVWCLPEGQTQADLRKLHKKIVKAVVSISALQYEGEDDMVCLFPPDQMRYGLGSEIVVEVTGLPASRALSKTIRQALAWKLGETVKKLYPKAKVECYVNTFDPDLDGCWFSDEPTFA